KLVHVRFSAPVAAKPDRALFLEVADDDPIGMPLPDRDFINADHPRRRMPGASELLAHVNLVEIFHRMPINMHSARDIFHRHRAAQASDLPGEPIGVPRIVRQKIELLGLHAATLFAVHAAIFKVEINLVISAIKITGAMRTPIIKATAGYAASAAHRFFSRRSSAMVNAGGSGP